jgi:hypothetical protein
MSMHLSCAVGALTCLFWSAMHLSCSHSVGLLCKFFFSHEVLQQQSACGAELAVLSWRC